MTPKKFGLILFENGAWICFDLKTKSVYSWGGDRSEMPSKFAEFGIQYDLHEKQTELEAA